MASPKGSSPENPRLALRPRGFRSLLPSSSRNRIAPFTWTCVAALMLPQRPAFAQSAPPVNTSALLPTYSIAQPDWPLWQLPSPRADRRGALGKGESFPLFAKVGAPGCKSEWWQVGPDAWLCPDEATLTQVANADATTDIRGFPEEMLAYVVVGSNGALGYRRREDVDLGSPNAEFQTGFLLGITQTSEVGESKVLLTTHGVWIPARDVQTVTPSAFQGAEVNGELDVAWAFERRSPVYSTPDAKQRPVASVERMERVTVTGQQQKPSGLWLRTEQGWLKSTDVRVPVPQLPPPEIGSDERWIDIDTSSQVLVAYIGPRPVFATLVSTGRGKPGSEQATPLGLHRLWIKLRRSDMDNLEDAETQSPYAVEAVPYVMFFDRGYGIHGTYWHDRFGVPKSHGCVNVSVHDARWLFNFTSPRLPLGWSAVFPLPRERGTLIRIH